MKCPTDGTFLIALTDGSKGLYCTSCRQVFTVKVELETPAKPTSPFVKLLLAMNAFGLLCIAGMRMLYYNIWRKL